MLLMATVASAQKPIEMNLWPEGPKTGNGDPQDMAKVEVFLPDGKMATGRAVVCCPGGGYSHLAWEKEGTSWAPFFNGQGIALIVLKYRMPHGNYTVPQEDADEAIRLVRRHAEEWHINVNDSLPAAIWHQRLPPTPRAMPPPTSRYSSIQSSPWSRASPIRVRATTC